MIKCMEDMIMMKYMYSFANSKASPFVLQDTEGKEDACTWRASEPQSARSSP